MLVLQSQESYPDASVAFRCPDSSPGVERLPVGARIPARFVAPAAVAGSNASVWIAHVSAPALSNTSGDVGSSPTDLTIYTVTVDCGGVVGLANATCVIDSSTGVSLDVTYQCPALVWTPSCGYVMSDSLLSISWLMKTLLYDAGSGMIFPLDGFKRDARFSA